MIHFIQPFDFNINIGKAYNDTIAQLSNDWICITDQDTLKFEGFAQRVKSITDISKNNYLITCKTNRLRKTNKCIEPGFYEEDSINTHQSLYHSLWRTYGNELTPIGLVPGMCMIFHKELWGKVKFQENSIVFDTQFSRSVLRAGGKLFIAKGLYIFHLYRWGKQNAENNIDHLINR